MNNQEELKQGNQIPSPPKQQFCGECGQEISAIAKKCYHCGSYQNRWDLRTYIPLGISLVMMMVAITQAILSYDQMNEAKKERISASKALKDAEDAKNIAKVASTQATKLSIQAKHRVGKIETLVTEANTTVNELKLLNEFLITLAKAQNDDRKAYDKLGIWEKDNSYPYREQATNAIVKIRTYFIGSLGPGYLKVAWKALNIDPSKLNISLLKNKYDSFPARLHADMVKYIYKRKDIQLKAKMEFLIGVLKKDESLTAIYYAGKYIAKEAKLEWNPFVITPLIEWWNKNQNRI